MIRLATFAFLSLLPLTALRAAEEAKPKPVDPQVIKTVIEGVTAPVAEVGGLVFTDTGGKWEKKEPRPMRPAILAYAKADKETPLEASFYFFGAGQGGDAAANVARWKKQFEGEPKGGEEEIAVGTSEKLVILHLTGTYLDGPPMGAKTPKAGYAMLGAIIPGKEAPVFIKMTGPEAAVAKAKDDFKVLAASAFAKK